MLTKHRLIAAGYRTFHDRSKASTLGDWYLGSFQKRFIDDTGTRYFLTISHCEIPMPHQGGVKQSFTPDTQFHRGVSTFNVAMLHHDEDIETVEAFFAEMWSTMKVDYYEGGPDEGMRFPQPDAPEPQSLGV